MKINQDDDYNLYVQLCGKTHSWSRKSPKQIPNKTFSIDDRFQIDSDFSMKIKVGCYIECIKNKQTIQNFIL